MSYILITPIKNEVRNIQRLKETITKQTVKPLLWVIGDGNSTDGSFQLAKELFKDEGWIHVIRQKTVFEDGYSHKNIAGNFNDCYEFARKICAENSIKYSFVARIDATPILARNYFEVILEELEKDSKLAFVCGLQHLQLEGSEKRLNQVAGISKTGISDQGIYRREFLEEMQGFPITYSPETVLQIKALNRGWRIKLTDKTYFIKQRLGGSKIGVWGGYKLKGKSMYSLGYHPLLLLFNTLYFCFKFTPKSIAILSGYFSSAIRREKRIEDREVLDYFGGKRLTQVFLDIIRRILV